MISDIINWWSAHIPPWLLIAAVVFNVILGTVAYLILLERKIASWVQDRIGPNRVGLDFGLFPFLRGMNGLGQPLADGIKFVMKEDYSPAGVDKVLFTLAPGVMILVVVLSIAVLPWGGTLQAQRMITIPEDVMDVQAYAANQLPMGCTLSSQPELVAGSSQYQITYRYTFGIADLNIGVLFILASLSLAVYGVVIGGWASNNKYSFLGGLRATANMISYEIPLGLSVLCIVVMFGTLDLNQIVQKQSHYWGIIPAWNVFAQPLAFVLFLVCIHAEANRAPFDLAEAEQELVGGYHTEYSAMRFALFFLAEYLGMIVTSAVCVALFWGGWQVPGLDNAVLWMVNHLFGYSGGQLAWVDPTNPNLTNSMILCIVRGLAFFVKTLVVIFVFMWVRWSLPRFRFDQLMMLAWRGLIPISLALLLATAIVVFSFHGQSFEQMGFPMALVLLVVNVGLTLAVMFVSRVVPPAPETNRKLRIIGSRYGNTPLPADLPR